MTNDEKANITKSIRVADNTITAKDKRKIIIWKKLEMVRKNKDMTRKISSKDLRPKA